MVSSCAEVPSGRAVRNSSEITPDVSVPVQTGGTSAMEPQSPTSVFLLAIRAGSLHLPKREVQLCLHAKASADACVSRGDRGDRSEPSAIAA
eukprot:1002195-Prymnesium_polylepis.2